MRKIVLIIAIVVAAGAAFLLYNVFGPAVHNPEKKFLYVPTGARYNQLKDSLRDGKFLSGFYFFDKIAGFQGLPEKVRPGRYKVEQGMSIFSLVKKLSDGAQDPVNLVLTKIRTPEDLAKRIGRLFEIDSAKAIQFLTNNDSLRAFGVDANTVLTDVFPDTYTYFWTADMSAIMGKLSRQREKFWTDERKEKAAHLKLTPNQVYILASIVEEETNKADDKGKIASVYINRLRKGMPLAADPTVKYAMKDFSLTRIYFKHLEIVSPYNTYKNKGLPPGPICTPSIKTIDAVLDAPETDYLFFVAKPDFSGHSNFAATFAEHQTFAAAYRKALDSLMKAKQQK